MRGSLSYYGRGGVYLAAPLITGWYVITFTPTNVLRDNLPLIASLVVVLLVAISIFVCLHEANDYQASARIR